MNEENSTKNAHLFRGLVISNMSLIERFVDNILAEFFAGNNGRYDDILGLVFCTDRITFYNKLCILREILKNNHNKIYKDKYHKILNQMIDELLPFRNKFAHCPITSVTGNDELIIELSRPKEGKMKTLTIDFDEMGKFNASTQLCIDALREVRELIKNSNR